MIFSNIYHYVKCPKDYKLKDAITNCLLCNNHIKKPPTQYLNKEYKTLKCSLALLLSPENVADTKKDYLFLRSINGKTKKQNESKIMIYDDTKELPERARRLLLEFLSTYRGSVDNLKAAWEEFARTRYYETRDKDVNDFIKETVHILRLGEVTNAFEEAEKAREEMEKK
jgi:hypothetical protein